VSDGKELSLGMECQQIAELAWLCSFYR